MLKKRKVRLLSRHGKKVKQKVDNKAQKKLAAVASWENTKKAAIQAELKETRGRIIEEEGRLCRKNAEHGCFNSQRRTMVEARKGEELLKAEEIASSIAQLELFRRSLVVLVVRNVCPNF